MSRGFQRGRGGAGGGFDRGRGMYTISNNFEALLKLQKKGRGAGGGGGRGGFQNRSFDAGPPDTVLGEQ
jgi:hypothetical protein